MKAKGFILTGLFLALITTVQGQTIREDLIGTWYLSEEEKKDEVLVFRPEGYSFPTSDERPGMAFKEGGEFSAFEPAPKDSVTVSLGTFMLNEESGILHISYETDGTLHHEQYTVVLAIEEILLLLKIE